MRRGTRTYTRLNQLLELLPLVSDSDARAQGVGVAALLYNNAGQYDLGLLWGERLVTEFKGDANACKGAYLKLEAQFRRGTLQRVGPEFAQGIDVCVRRRNRCGRI